MHLNIYIICCCELPWRMAPTLKHKFSMIVPHLFTTLSLGKMSLNSLKILPWHNECLTQFYHASFHHASANLSIVGAKQDNDMLYSCDKSFGSSAANARVPGLTAARLSTRPSPAIPTSSLFLGYGIPLSIREANICLCICINIYICIYI